MTFVPPDPKPAKPPKATGRVCAHEGCGKPVKNHNWKGRENSLYCSNKCKLEVAEEGKYHFGDCQRCLNWPE